MTHEPMRAWSQAARRACSLRTCSSWGSTARRARVAHARLTASQPGEPTWRRCFMRSNSDLQAAKRSGSQEAVESLLAHRLHRLGEIDFQRTASARPWLLADDSIFVALARSPAGIIHLVPVQSYIAARQQVLEDKGLASRVGTSWSRNRPRRKRPQECVSALASQVLDFSRSKKFL